MALKPRQIEAFRAVMREGSMVRASAAMAITQPAVSYLISSLESAVGFSLFSRHGGKLSATPEALQLMAEVDRLYEGLESIEATARQIATYDKAVVRILITQAIAASRILTCIGQFAAAHPGLRLDIDVNRRSTILHKISSGQVDLGILSLSPDLEPVGTELLSSELLCLSPSATFFGDLEAVAPQNLAGIPIVTLKTSGLIRKISDAWFSAAAIEPNYVIEVADPRMAIELVRGGLGVTIASSLSLPPGKDFGLEARPLSPKQQVEIGTITPTSQHPNRPVKALIDFLKSRLAE